MTLYMILLTFTQAALWLRIGAVSDRIKLLETGKRTWRP